MSPGVSFPVDLARTFSGAKRVQSPVLNRFGIQVARSIVARCAYLMRSRRHPLVNDLASQGMAIVESFLPTDELFELKKEADRLGAEIAPTSVDQHGPSQVQRWALSALDDHQFPRLRGYASDRRLLDLAEAAERRTLRTGDGLRMFERVVFDASEVHDRESDLHIDTFYSTHKLWLYIDDVEEANGPLVYVPGSHRLSRARLRGDYAESRGDNSGSRRITNGEVEELGLQPEVLTCQANTLVIVNTCGYHRRSQGQPGHTRRALHMGFRFNPFLPHFVRALEPVARRHPTAARVLALAVKGE